MNYIKLEFITPDNKLVFDRTVSISARSKEGEFMILPDHEPFFAVLNSDLVSFNTENSDKIEEIFAINPILKISDNKCIIFADEIRIVENITLAEVNSRAEKLVELIPSITDGEMLLMSKKELENINAMKEVASK